MRWLAWLFPLLVALGLTGTAAAQAADAAADAEARARFEAGRAAMAAGRIEDALTDFRRAYELSHRPELLYNVAIAADRLRRDEEALSAFERYLAEMPPDVENRAAVESRIAVLRETIAEEEAEEAAAPAERGLSAAGIALAITGGVLAVGGAILLGVGVSERLRVENAPERAPWADYAGSAERAPIFEGVGGAATGVGLALAATGVVLLVTDGGGAGEVAVLPFGAGAQVRGRF